MLAGRSEVAEVAWAKRRINPHAAKDLRLSILLVLKVNYVQERSRESRIYSGFSFRVRSSVRSGSGFSQVLGYPRRIALVGLLRTEVRAPGSGPAVPLELTNFCPKRLEVRVVEGHELDFVAAADDESALEPGAGGVELAHLAGVTSDIVGDGRFLGKFVESGQQRVPCFFHGALGNAAQGVSLMEPASRAFGRGFQKRASNLQAFVPTLFFGAQKPADFQDIRMLGEFGIDLVQLRVSFDNIAELQPTDGGGEAVNLCWLKFLHSCQCEAVIYPACGGRANLDRVNHSA